MTWETACRIYKQIADAKFDDPYGLKSELVRRAIRYARIRTDWRVKDRAARDRMHEERTAAHNAFIDACNILSRQMQAQGLDVSWRIELGEDRLESGDFACYVHCILGIEAR